jgi:hypothetical protein
LVLVQAALVAAPARPRRLVSSRALGLAIPAAAMVVGVAAARAHGGAGLLAALAAVATPAVAAAAGWARGWRLPWLAALLVPPLYALAWFRPGTLAGEAASVALIAGACLAASSLVAALAPQGWLSAGLVLLVALDVFLVWGNRQITPTMHALSAATPPTLGHVGRPLPSLQQVEFGSVTMGWLDLAAPALLGLLVASRARAAAATGLAAGAWGLLLMITSPIAATPPVLAGLVAGRLRRGSPATRAGKVRPAAGFGPPGPPSLLRQRSFSLYRDRKPAYGIRGTGAVRVERVAAPGEADKERPFTRLATNPARGGA